MALPKHIAIIMDGNGRWASENGLPRIMGHRSGVKTVDVITEHCARRGIKALTMYTFSSENWKRPKKEVDALMDLIERTLKKNSKKMLSNNIKFNTIGRTGDLPNTLQEVIKNLKEDTSSNSGMILTLALNYGGRQEIIDAVREASSTIGEKTNDINEDDFENFLYTRGLPELDLVIRTSGEMRISNFLLWQSAYAEFYVTKTLWPDFSVGELEKALDEYDKRERRFGA